MPKKVYSWYQIAEIRQGRIDKLLEEVAAMRGEVERLEEEAYDSKQFVAHLTSDVRRLEGKLRRCNDRVPLDTAQSVDEIVTPPKDCPHCGTVSTIWTKSFLGAYKCDHCSQHAISNHPGESWQTEDVQPVTQPTCPHCDADVAAFDNGWYCYTCRMAVEEVG